MIAVHWVLLAQSEMANEINHTKHQLAMVEIVLELQAEQDLGQSVPVQLVNRQVSTCLGYVSIVFEFRFDSVFRDLIVISHHNRIQLDLIKLDQQPIQCGKIKASKQVTVT